MRHENAGGFNYRRFMESYSLVMILVVFMAVCSVANDTFLTQTNMLNVFRQQSIVIILALGEMLLIIGGMLDLSAGSVLALSGVLSVMTFKSADAHFAANPAPGSTAVCFLLAIAVGVGVAVACNIVNGIMVTRYRTPPFIATLAMQAVSRGAVLYICNGTNIYRIGELTVIGQGSLLGIPNPVYVLVAVVLVMVFVMRNTVFGRSVYAVGGNEEAANASGIGVNSVKMRAFVVNGILVGIAGVIFMSRVNGGVPNGGIGYEFDALTATIIGGTSFSGGSGTVFGTVIGAFLVGFLNNIMNLVSINSYVQQMVRGFIIAVAVIWDIYSKRQKTYGVKTLRKDRGDDAGAKNGTPAGVTAGLIWGIVAMSLF
ncbi:MAG: ABC transporter permease, partial [Planctomycetota bacterium]|nr:ABC transporter permease [Planctomycetota bacterium]